jgi:maleylacetate reductase
MRRLTDTARREARPPRGRPALRRFTYTAQPGCVVFAAGAARTVLAPEVERLGARRVLLIATDRDRALIDELAAPLGDRIAGRFSEVRPHVPLAVAERARAAARDTGADALVAVGGGSTIGTAKAIALESGVPIAAVPTTYAGSEMTPVWGLTDARRKTTGTDPRVLPRVVVYDPELTFALPAAVTGPSAMNAMAHCVEAFYAPGANPIADLMAEEGIRALAAGVPGAVARPTELESRAETLYGAYLAGAAFAVVGSALHHKVCHVLGGAYDLPHAGLHTVMLPQVTAFLEPALPDVMARVARALGDRGRDGAAVGLYDLAAAIGAPTALEQIGMRADDLDAAARLALAKVPADTPRPLAERDVRSLLERAFTGRRPSPARRTAAG